MSTENIDIERNEMTTQVPLLGPGERLREARLALDIDIEVVAKKLRLTPDVVEAIERDDYSKIEMTARVFVRGYVRNYARLVELPVDTILEQFDAIWPDDDRPVVFNQPPQLASDSHLGKRWSGMVNWLLLLIVVILFLAWSQGYLDEFIQQNVETISSSEPSQEVQQPTLIQEQPQEQTQTEPQPVPEPVTPEPAATEEVSAPEQAEQGVVEQVEQPVEDNPVDDTSAEEAAQTEVVEQAAEEPVVAQQASTDQKEIYISFSGPCWVDIRDSERSFKILGQMKQGDKHKLGGTPPYNVVIGNTDVVSITVDGQPFDIKPYTNGSVARFTLTL